MKKIWIIGAGKFGIKAIHALSRHCPEAQLTVIDTNCKGLETIDLLNIHLVTDDGIRFLYENMDRSKGPDWIIPAIPMHVAYEWVARRLKDTHIVKKTVIPDEVLESLPNPIQGSSGAVYISNADFICPDDCMEPEGLCSCTGKPRPRIMHEFLTERNFSGFQSIVIQSHQLAPGVGGYSPHSLYEAQSLACSATAPVLMSTACKCHGVMNAFQVEFNSNV